MTQALAPIHEVEIVEVGPRDGFQPIGPFIPTEQKLGFVDGAAKAGLRRIEIGSFVSAKAVPQMADTPEVLQRIGTAGGLLPQVLVPTYKRGVEALAAGAPMIAFVLSVSEAHNRNNVRQSPGESADAYAELMQATPAHIPVRLNLATSLDCPFDGRVAPDEVLALLERLVPMRPDAEVCLCDTTGRAAPAEVRQLFAQARSAFPDVRHWALHAHDTYGRGVANVFAAFEEGVRVFDAAMGGLGGCPFAPGATGNVATEDLVSMFDRMGVSTGVTLDALVPLANRAAALPGAQAGGQVRHVVRQMETTIPG
ncbi:hydroxymethylglutaryl-CoA lyase [Aureimonas altamirensis DSM 21988]|uniref:Hydroxymethylglutaryl-CoA lyase n=1 Tax=Aureimonas altamirensis DSM 21988 TaxID=1121026 RepID=A0ABY1IH78_9HYPH|nr:hydroxymethylglutaryl-CoA lyase [Aureimonas altamirensis]SHJ16871.1 hydroxymethylglutaryl-CoA lyase [Aureimonas altamirensis DSM 21988]